MGSNAHGNRDISNGCSYGGSKEQATMVHSINFWWIFQLGQ
jgi:hypothetical protein